MAHVYRWHKFTTEPPGLQGRGNGGEDVLERLPVPPGRGVGRFRRLDVRRGAGEGFQFLLDAPDFRGQASGFRRLFRFFFPVRFL